MVSRASLWRCQTRKSSPQCEEEGPGREIYPGVAYFIEYRPSEACNESKIFSILHNADMEPTVTKLRTQNSASTIFQVLKDHANEAVQNLVRESNSFWTALLSDQGLTNCRRECHRTSNAHDGSSPKSWVKRIGSRDRIPCQRHRPNTWNQRRLDSCHVIFFDQWYYVFFWALARGQSTRK